MVVEGYDWGPGASKVILPLGEIISTVQKEDYSVTAKKKATCTGVNLETTTGERTIVQAYVSDEKGKEVAEGKHITLVLSVAPTLDISSPMQYIPQCGGNVWVDYKMNIKHNSTNQVWDIESDRIHPLIDAFDLSWKFVYNSEIT